MEDTGSYWFKATTYRLKGNICMGLGDSKGSSAWFKMATYRVYGVTYRVSGRHLGSSRDSPAEFRGITSMVH